MIQQNIKINDKPKKYIRLPKFVKHTLHETKLKCDYPISSKFKYKYFFPLYEKDNQNQNKQLSYPMKSPLRNIDTLLFQTQAEKSDSENGYYKVSDHVKIYGKLRNNSLCNNGKDFENSKIFVEENNVNNLKKRENKSIISNLKIPLNSEKSSFNHQKVEHNHHLQHKNSDKITSTSSNVSSYIEGNEEIHEIWDNTDFIMKGIDLEKGVDPLGNEFNFFNLYKARYSSFPSKREAIDNQGVINQIRSLDTINGKHPLPNIGKYPWYTFEDTLDCSIPFSKDERFKNFLHYWKDLRGSFENSKLNQRRKSTQEGPSFENKKCLKSDSLEEPLLTSPSNIFLTSSSFEKGKFTYEKKLKFDGTISSFGQSIRKTERNLRTPYLNLWFDTDNNISVEQLKSNSGRTIEKSRKKNGLTGIIKNEICMFDTITSEDNNYTKKLQIYPNEYGIYPKTVIKSKDGKSHFRIMTQGNLKQEIGRKKIKEFMQVKNKSIS